MQYLGGKSRIARRLGEVIREVRRGRRFWDPFCGGLSMSVELSRDAPGLASDVSPALISMYKAVAAGWDPPLTLSEAEYLEARTLPDGDPIKAFAGFGCSFGGKWFAGYARNSRRDSYASWCRSALLRDIRTLVDRGVEFACLDFMTVEPGPTDEVLYLDPPYFGTTGYSGAPKFDHVAFTDRALRWSRFTDVFVSEYAFPMGRVAAEFPARLSLGVGAPRLTKTERLFHCREADH